MKICELLNGITVPITNEESEVLNKIQKSGRISKSELSPREQLLARSLVNKDILSRKTENGKIIFIKKIR